MEMEHVIYTMAEAAKLLHINVNTMNNLRRAGLIRCLKLGAWKVRREELLRFLKDSEGMDVTDPFNPKEV